MTCEDGTGVTGAVCYVEASYVSTYLAATGRDIPWSSATDAQRDLAIQQASAWIDMTFGTRFVGYPLTTTQGLEFPRTMAYDRYGNALTGLPELFKRAVAEMSIRALADGDAIFGDAPVGGNVSSESTTVGPITISKTFTGAKDSAKRFPIIARLLQQGGMIDSGGWAQR